MQKIVTTLLLQFIFTFYIFGSSGQLDSVTSEDNEEFLTSEDEEINDSKESKQKLNILPQKDFKKEDQSFQKRDSAVILAINKVTAKSKEIKIKIGETKYFGNISIQIHKCVKNLNKYRPDNYLLITVTENKIDDDPNNIFQGWITSGNIAISTMEHPVYELFLQECI